jgi:hypothetical protein
MSWTNVRLVLVGACDRHSINQNVYERMMGRSETGLLREGDGFSDSSVKTAFLVSLSIKRP